MAAMGGKLTLGCAVAQSFDEQREGRRLLPAARVIEVVAGKWRGPIGKHTRQLASLHIEPSDVLRNEGDSYAVQRRLPDHGDVVDGELSLNLHVHFARALLELPGV